MSDISPISNIGAAGTEIQVLVDVLKRSEELQKDSITELLQMLGIGQNVDLQA